MTKDNQEKYLEPAEQKEKNNQPEKPKDIEGILVKSLENIFQFEPSDKDGHLRKMILQENISDVMATLREDEMDSLNLLVAYRGLEQIQKNGSLQKEDFGISEAMNVLRKKIQEKEGFDIGEIEDLDQAFEKTRGEVRETVRKSKENISEEEAVVQKDKFERYFSLKQEIQVRQRQILGESKSFYRGISEKISGPLFEFLTEKGEKIDDKMKNSSVALLKYIGKYEMSSKLARAVGLGIITAGALGFIFKGEITEAAQYENEASDDRGDKTINGWVSPEELKLKDPEVYRLLEERGFIKKANLEYEEDKPDIKERKAPSGIPEIFKDALRQTNAAKILETDEYQNANTSRELKGLYDKFNEKDDDPSDDLAVAVKYNQFLQTRSKEELVAEYGEEGAEKIFQEAGFVTFKSLEKYFDKDIQDGAITSENLGSYLEGFKKASDFYKNSIALIEKPLKQGEMHKSFSGLIEMNKVLSNISNTLVIYGDKEDKLVAAETRKLAHENIKEFERLEKDVSVVDLGDGKFLFPNMKDMGGMLKGIIQHEIGENNGEKMIADWIKRDAGGVNYYTNEIVKYINEKNLKGAISKDDHKLVEVLLNSKILIKTEKGYIQNPEKPYVLFTGINAYNHENQHHEFVKNDALMKYWIKEWNTQRSEWRKKFIKTFPYRNLSEKDIKILAEKNFTFEDIKKNFIENSEGAQTQPLSDHKYELLQEFQAYSTDNLKIRIFNPDYEIE